MPRRHHMNSLYSLHRPTFLLLPDRPPKPLRQKKRKDSQNASKPANAAWSPAVPRAHQLKMNICNCIRCRHQSSSTFSHFGHPFPGSSCPHRYPLSPICSCLPGPQLPGGRWRCSFCQELQLAGCFGNLKAGRSMSGAGVSGWAE